jgi:hypothetical protein
LVRLLTDSDPSSVLKCSYVTLHRFGITPVVNRLKSIFYLTPFLHFCQLLFSKIEGGFQVQVYLVPGNRRATKAPVLTFSFYASTGYV